MIPCISVENMRLSDAYTIANFVPSLTLMHRAAYGVYLAHKWQGNTAIVAGSGNNGGDGFALACILKEKGFNCTVFTLGSKLSADSLYYADRASALGVSVCTYEHGCLHGFDTVVDCLLGTGFQGSLRDNYRTAITDINASDAFVVSVDINSGMNGDTGDCILAVRSDLTVTIGFIKNGLISPNAGKYMKRLVCTDIGITLVREENRICASDEWQDGCFLCPAWLDMNVISTDNIITK